jgi:hypothetical protein
MKHLIPRYGIVQLFYLERYAKLRPCENSSSQFA